MALRDGQKEKLFFSRCGTLCVINTKGHLFRLNTKLTFCGIYFLLVFRLKDLLNQRPKPHDCKIRQISTEIHRFRQNPQISVVCCGFLDQKLQNLMKTTEICMEICGFQANSKDFDFKVVKLTNSSQSRVRSKEETLIFFLKICEIRMENPRRFRQNM